MAEHEKQLHQDEKAKKTQEAHPRHNNPIVVPAYNIQRTGTYHSDLSIARHVYHSK